MVAQEFYLWWLLLCGDPRVLVVVATVWWPKSSSCGSCYCVSAQEFLWWLLLSADPGVLVVLAQSSGLFAIDIPASQSKRMTGRLLAQEYLSDLSLTLKTTCRAAFLSSPGPELLSN